MTDTTSPSTHIPAPESGAAHPAPSPAAEPPTWPDLAIGLYERLTGRGAAINYELRDMVVEVPQRVGADAPRAVWRLSGTLRVTADEPGQHPGHGA